VSWTSQDIHLGDIRLDKSVGLFGSGECNRDARVYACTQYAIVYSTRLQNYTIGASLLCIRIRIPKSNISLVHIMMPEYYVHTECKRGRPNLAIYPTTLRFCM